MALRLVGALFPSACRSLQRYRTIQGLIQEGRASRRRHFKSPSAGATRPRSWSGKCLLGQSTALNTGADRSRGGLGSWPSDLSHVSSLTGTQRQRSLLRTSGIMGVLRFRPSTGALYLASYHPGLSPEKLAENTGFPLDIEGATETATSIPEELRILRVQVDPERVFLN